MFFVKKLVKGQAEKNCYRKKAYGPGRKELLSGKCIRALEENGFLAGRS